MVRVGSLGSMRQHRCVVSDEAWAWMEPLLPSSAGRRGGRWRDHRQVIEAIAWRYRTGSPWRELPEQFGPWQTAYERLTRWSSDGTWANLLAGVNHPNPDGRHRRALIAKATAGHGGQQDVEPRR